MKVVLWEFCDRKARYVTGHSKNVGCQYIFYFQFSTNWKCNILDLFSDTFYKTVCDHSA